MNIGINTFLYASPFTTHHTVLFPKFKKWGFDSVELAIEDPGHIDPSKVLKAARKSNLKVGSLCAAMGPGRDFRGTHTEQKTAMVYLKALVDQAVLLDCPVVAGPLYSVVGKADAVEKEQQKKEWALVVKNLKILARYAELKHVLLCVEPLNRFETDFLNTVDQALRLIKAVNSSALKIHLDTFHMNIEEKHLDAAIIKAGEHLGHLHACGSDRGTPGGDHTDWKSIAKALKKIRYNGGVVIESFTTDVKVIARAAAIWRKIESNRDSIAKNGFRFLKQALR
jgi:D-psicose/D-tagatose/L-ribulose 3-epimerase